MRAKKEKEKEKEKITPIQFASSLASPVSHDNDPLRAGGWVRAPIFSLFQNWSMKNESRAFWRVRGGGRYLSAFSPFFSLQTFDPSDMVRFYFFLPFHYLIGIRSGILPATQSGIQRGKS